MPMQIWTCDNLFDMNIHSNVSPKAMNNSYSFWYPCFRQQHIFFTYIILYQLHTLQRLISCFETFSPSFKQKNEKEITFTISIPWNCHSTEFCVNFLSFFLLTLYLFLNGKHYVTLRCNVTTDFLQCSKVSPKVESQSRQKFNVDKRLQWTSTWKIRIGFTPRFRLSHLFV